MIDLEKLRKSSGYVLAIVNTKTGEYEPVIKDVALITRCKDCKWFGKAGCAVNIVDESDEPKEYDYCSWAERKEE